MTWTHGVYRYASSRSTEARKTAWDRDATINGRKIPSGILFCFFPFVESKELGLLSPYTTYFWMKRNIVYSLKNLFSKGTFSIALMVQDFIEHQLTFDGVA